jgi:hypothetical protein
MRSLGSRIAFDNEVISEETKRFLADDRHHLVLGYIHDRAAGFCRRDFPPGQAMRTLPKRDRGYGREVVAAGVACALIHELKRLGRERGCVSMWVLTDEGNELAMGQYRSTGGRWDGEPLGAEDRPDGT